MQSFRLPPTEKIVFVATGRLVTPQLIRELPVVSNRYNNFDFHSFKITLIVRVHYIESLVKENVTEL